MDVSSNPLKRGATSSTGKDEGKRAKTELVDSKIDKISDLPEPAIHQILSRLHPKDAARSCVLSKRWLHAWNLYQTLDFDLCLCNKNKTKFLIKKKKKNKTELDSYKSKFSKLLKRRKEQALNIYKFRLRLHVTKKLLEHVYPWISDVLEKNVRELEIQAKGRNSYMLAVPLPVFRGSLITTLTLYGCTLPSISNLVVDLPKLQRLSLKSLSVNIEFLEKMFTSCPNIDELRLIQCCDLKHLFIRASCRVIKRLDVHKCRDLRRIVVENPRLESLWFYSGMGKNCSLKLTECIALKNLVLECRMINDAKFQDLILEFTELEKLVLSRCYNLKNIQISGDKLKKLVIRRCSKLIEARVNAPNLVSLEYQGQSMPFVFNTTLSHLKEAFLRFGPSAKGKTNWKVDEANRLKGLFSHLFDLTSLKMMTITKQEVDIYEEIPTLFSPETRINKSHSVIISASYHDLLTEALLKWPYPCKLSVYSHGDSEFSEDIYKTLDKGKGEIQCCAYFKNKCWKHYLTRIKAEKWVSESSQFAYLGGREWRLTVFSLDWKKVIVPPLQDSKKPVDDDEQ